MALQMSRPFLLACLLLATPIVAPGVHPRRQAVHLAASFGDDDDGRTPGQNSDQEVSFAALPVDPSGLRSLVAANRTSASSGAAKDSSGVGNGRAGVEVMRQEIQGLEAELGAAKAHGSGWDEQTEAMEKQLEDLEEMLRKLEAAEDAKKRRTVTVSHAEIQAEIDRLKEAVARIEGVESGKDLLPPDLPDAEEKELNYDMSGKDKSGKADNKEHKKHKKGEKGHMKDKDSSLEDGADKESGDGAGKSDDANEGKSKEDADDKSEKDDAEASAEGKGSETEDDAVAGAPAPAKLPDDDEGDAPGGAASLKGKDKGKDKDKDKASEEDADANEEAPADKEEEEEKKKKDEEEEKRDEEGAEAGSAQSPAEGAEEEEGQGQDPAAPVPAAGPPGPPGLDIDSNMPYGDLEPFGREDTAQELTEDSIHQSDAMVDQLERAEVAEERRAVFRALTRLRGAAITSFDGVARSQTGNIDEYARENQWRKAHPVHHLADEESDTSRWAFPDSSDF